PSSGGPTMAVPSPPKRRSTSLRAVCSWSPGAGAAPRNALGFIRDIHRKIAGKADLEALFEWPLTRAKIRSQRQRQRGWKLYSFRPLEFRRRGPIAPPHARAPGGQFVLHAKTLPDNPYDGHTLAVVIEDTERL